MASYSTAPTAFSGFVPARPERPDPTRLDRSARRSATVLLALITIAVAVIVFWPGPPDPGGQSALYDFIERAHANGLPARITFNVVQNLANVAMFLPVGLLGSLALRRHNYLIVPYAALASGSIELIQLLFLPGRVASMEDVVSNTAGALIGLLVSIPALRRRAGRRRRYLQGRRSASDSRRRSSRAARL